MEIGVVVWAEGLTVKFRIKSGVFVERGELVKVVDRNVKFILRVYDFKPESLLTPAEIARLSEKRERGEEIVLYDRNIRLYDTAIATIVAQVDEDGVVRGPTSVPALFTQVESLEAKDLAQLNLDTGDLPLGYVRVGHRASNKIVSLNGRKVIPHHILVSGVTGAGKSNLGRVLAAAIMMAEEPIYSLVLFDCESEYFSGPTPDSMGLAHLPEAEDRLFYVTGKVVRPSKIEFKFEFEGEERIHRILAHPLEVAYSDLSPADFSMTGEFSGPQEELLWLARRVMKEDWLSFLLNTSAEGIYRRLRGLAHKNTINTVKRKLRYLLGDGDIFREFCDTSLFHAVLNAVGMGKVVLIDIPHATEGEEKLLSVAVTRRIFKTYEELRKVSPSDWEKLPYTLITVEEAHRYLSKTSLTSGGEVRENIFSIISKRGRKYKVGALYITQMPGELIEPVVRQTLTKIILPLPTKPDYTKIIQYSPFLDEAEQEIKTLDRGEALIVSPISGLRFAVPVRIFKFEDIAVKRLRGERLAYRRSIRITSIN